jgi:alpha-ribazole phosphatase
MNESTRWWWIRHAPVVVNNGLVYGQVDHPCDCTDEPTFRALAGILPKDAVWVTSTLRRTRQTADAIRAHIPELSDDPRAEPDLMEQHFGDRQGIRYDEVRQASFGEWHRFWSSPLNGRPEGGESFADLMHRVSATISRLSLEHKGRNIIAVTHGGTIRVAVALALKIEPEAALRLAVDNCSLSRLDLMLGPIGSHDPDEREFWRVRFVNMSPSCFAKH